MLQRIQTIYLLIASVLISLTAMLPLADLIGKDEQVFYQNAQGIFQTIGEGAKVNSTLSLQLTLLLIVILLVITIFSFRNRIFQIRLCYINAALIALFYGMFFLFENSIQVTFNAVTNYRIALSFPLVSFVLNWLAIRGIKKDEALVKSLNRIR